MACASAACGALLPSSLPHTPCTPLPSLLAHYPSLSPPPSPNLSVCLFVFRFLSLNHAPLPPFPHYLSLARARAHTLPLPLSSPHPPASRSHHHTATRMRFVDGRESSMRHARILEMVVLVILKLVCINNLVYQYSSTNNLVCQHSGIGNEGVRVMYPPPHMHPPPHRAKPIRWW